jgi:hypothetical protein
MAGWECIIASAKIWMAPIALPDSTGQELLCTLEELWKNDISMAFSMGIHGNFCDATWM